MWAPREDIEAGRGDFANSIGAEIMRKAASIVIVFIIMTAPMFSYYASYWRVGYPLPKMDLMYEAKKVMMMTMMMMMMTMMMTMMPLQGGAMENWGLVLFAPRTLLLDPATTTEEDTWRVVNVIAHELSHQVLAVTRMITESVNICDLCSGSATW